MPLKRVAGEAEGGTGLLPASEERDASLVHGGRTREDRPGSRVGTCALTSLTRLAALSSPMPPMAPPEALPSPLSCPCPCLLGTGGNPAQAQVCCKPP